MAVEQNKAMVREYIEQVWNRKRTDLIEQYLAEDVVHRDAPGLTDRESIHNTIVSFLEAVPDFKVSIENLVGEGDWVAFFQMISGTQEGEMNGIPATGKQFSVPGMYFVRFADGKIAEIRGFADNLSMMQQLGLVPVPQAG